MDNKFYYVYLKYCTTCLAQKEMIRRIKPDFPDIEFIEIDMYDEEEAAKAVDPELIYPFFRFGEGTYDSYMKRAELLDFIEKYK